MSLTGIDLNLLTALDALLDEASVTRAAKRLHLSQPAASHALRRLRELLGDPLLVRTPTGMQLTPHALELRPVVRGALAAAAAVLQAAPAFDPRSADRSFAIAVPDQAAAHLLPTLMPRLAATAPRVRLAIQPQPSDVAVALANGDVELAVGVYSSAPPPSIHQDTLWDETFTCVVRRGGPWSRGKLDLARYLTAHHLFISPRGIGGGPIDELLARAGHTRTIALRVPQFLLAPQIVAATDLMWTAPTKLARTFAGQLPLVLREPPFAVPGFAITMRWHLRFDRDPGLAWLRGELHHAARARPPRVGIA